MRGTTLAQVFRKTQKASTSIDEEFGSSGFFSDFRMRFPEGVSSFCFISQVLDIQPMLWDLPIYLVPPPSNSHNFEGLKVFFWSQEPSQEDLIIIKWCCPLQTAIEQICGHHHVLTGFWIWLLPFEIRSLEGFLLEFPRYHNEFCYDSLSLVKPKDFFRWIMSSHDICGTAFSRRIDLQRTDLQI